MSNKQVFIKRVGLYWLGRTVKELVMSGYTRIIIEKENDLWLVRAWK